MKNPKEIEASGNNPSQKKSYQTFEEEVLKDFEEWREKGNWTSDNKAVKKAISLTFQKSQEMMRKEIEKCKIHTAGVLILIEKKELLSKIGGKE